MKQWIKRQMEDPQLSAFWKTIGILICVVVVAHIGYDSDEKVSQALAMIGAILTMMLFKVYEIAEILRRRRWPKVKRNDPRTENLTRRGH